MGVDSSSTICSTFLLKKRSSTSRYVLPIHSSDSLPIFMTAICRHRSGGERYTHCIESFIHVERATIVKERGATGWRRLAKKERKRDATEL